MKRFLFVISLFLVPYAIIMGLVEYGIRQIPNDYSFKKAWLEQNISSVDILITGSSQGYFGINPRFLSDRAFNACHVSQTHKYDAFILDKFIDRADSLKFVIIPIAYHSLVSDLESGPEWWRARSYRLYYDCLYHPMELKYNLEIVGSNMKLQTERLYKYLRYGEDVIISDERGYGTTYVKETREPERWWADGDKRAKLHTKDLSKAKETIAENKAHLEHIAQLCQEHNVKLLFVTTPTNSSYYDNLDSTQYAMVVEYCDSLARAYEEVRYLNLIKDERFVEDEFYDSDHLCSNGAEKLSMILSDELTEEKWKD